MAIEIRLLRGGAYAVISFLFACIILGADGLTPYVPYVFGFIGFIK